MTLEPRQKTLLWVLAGLLVVLGWNRLGDLIPSVGTAGPAGGQNEPERARALATDVVGLDTSLLDPPSGEFELGRDPFRYGEVPRPKVERPKPPEPKPRVDPEPVVEPEPQGPRPPSVSHLAYLGSFGREGQKIAVLTSGEEIYNLREGETFEESFSIAEIGYESVAIGFVDFPDEPPKRLPVGG